MYIIYIHNIYKYTQFLRIGKIKPIRPSKECDSYTNHLETLASALSWCVGYYHWNYQKLWRFLGLSLFVFTAAVQLEVTGRDYFPLRRHCCSATWSHWPGLLPSSSSLLQCNLKSLAGTTSLFVFTAAVQLEVTGRNNFRLYTLDYFL